MSQSLAQNALIVRVYDEAIAWVIVKLGLGHGELPSFETEGAHKGHWLQRAHLRHAKWP